MHSMMNRLLAAPQKTFLLFGPRGTGKSTWLKKNIACALSIDLLQSRDYLQLIQNPSHLRKLTAHLKKGDWVVIDEIQKVPALMDEVHALYEEKIINFALSGSSARKLKRGGANLLAGRALQTVMFPLVYREYAKHWSIDRSLLYGSLPLIVDDQKHMEQTLYTYVKTYLKEELTEEGIIRKLEPFARFLRSAAMYNAQILNVENVARESAVSRSTVDQYFEILTDTLLGHKLEPLQLGFKKKEVSHPKFYWFDCGVARAASGLSVEDADSVYKGFAFETNMINEVCAYNSYSQKNKNLFFYAVSSGYDVDLLIETRPKTISKKPEYVCVEFKNSKKMDKRWGESLLDLAESDRLHISKSFVVYRGEETKVIQNIHYTPAEFFLEQLNSADVF